MDSVYDVIVVGSGIGGLSATAKTSAKKAKTLLLEAMPSIGGYTNPYKIQGFSFDTGLHYIGDLGEKGSLRRKLEKLGVYNKVKFIEINPNCIGKYYFNNSVFCLPKGIENFKRNILKLFPEEKRTVDKLIKLLLEIKEATEIGIKGPKHPKFVLYIPKLKKFMEKPYGRLIDEITNNKKLKYIFSLMSGEAGLPPDKASPFTATILLHYLQGAYYPKGGSGALRDAFVNTIKENGGIIKTSQRVVKITRENNLFKVLTTKSIFFAKSIISDIDPTILFLKILDDKINSPSLKEKAKRTEPSWGSFYAFLATDLELEKYGFSDSNLINTEDCDLNLSFNKWQEFKNFFITIPTLKDPESNHAPKGLHTIEVITMAPFEPFKKWSDKLSRNRGKEYINFKNKLGEKLIKKLEKYIPNLSNHLIFKDFATPLSNLYWVNVPKGGNYGPNQTPDQMGPNRFPIKTEIDGLYLCGAGTIAGGIAPSIISGDLAGSLALRNIK